MLFQIYAKPELMMRHGLLMSARFLYGSSYLKKNKSIVICKATGCLCLSNKWAGYCGHVRRKVVETIFDHIPIINLNHDALIS